MVTLLYRFAEAYDYDLTADGALTDYVDAADVQSYATEPMRWAVGSGIVNGVEGKRLAPQDTATRAQFATVVYRLATLAKDAE